jgi:hypothetical protein
MMPPVPILRDSTPVAFPAFRSLFWLAGSLNDEGPAIVADRLASWFWKTHGAGVTRVTLLHDDAIQIVDAAPPAVLPKVKAWLDARDKTFGATLMMSGGPAVDADDEAPDGETPPHLRIEEAAACVMIEVSLPPDTPDPVPAADAIAGLCVGQGLVFGLQGMGYMLSPAMDSVVARLPLAHARYRTAIELRLSDPPDAIMTEGSTLPWDEMPGARPGLPDIGWRTWIGPALAAGLVIPPELGPFAGPFGVMVQAGPQPVWGDVNRGEDIAAFQAVAAALAPAMLAPEVAAILMFGGTTDDPDLADRLETYMARFAS